MNRIELYLGSAAILVGVAGYLPSADQHSPQLTHPQICHSSKFDCLELPEHTQTNKSLSPVRWQDQDAKSDDPKSETEAERNQRLAKYLSGTRWTGRFTFGGQGDKEPAEEKYEIIEAKKGETGDDWNLTARIQYGGKDVTLPLPTLQIKWAGETPVITVDKMVIPGMGTFDARVLIRKGQYAGTWAHGEVGGHMFGTIERMEAAPAEKKSDD